MKIREEDMSGVEYAMRNVDAVSLIDFVTYDTVFVEWGYEEAWCEPLSDSDNNIIGLYIVATIFDEELDQHCTLHIGDYIFETMKFKSAL